MVGRRRWKNNIIMDLKGIGCRGADEMQLPYDRD
jgi:hypothetical protein